MTHPHEQLLTGFYTAFSKRDPGPMRAAYAPDAHFSDAAFPELYGASVGDMWTMLCEQAKDFRLEFRDVKADDRRGTAHWEAWYRFGGKRPVHNVIEASFTFENGLIKRHVDSFDFYRWSKQALGPAGLVLGWTPFLRKAVQSRANASLVAWQKRNAR
ncbi:MAG: nuclear transport factor 2 family protein [Myxococcota bacterium]